MNNRIRELFKRAGGKTSIHNLMSNPVQHREYNELWDENITKFAELIVRECLGIVDDAERGGSNDIWDNAVKFIRRDLQEHFGVE
jgi:hypothetical protein